MRGRGRETETEKENKLESLKGRSRSWIISPRGEQAQTSWIHSRTREKTRTAILDQDSRHPWEPLIPVPEGTYCHPTQRSSVDSLLACPNPKALLCAECS